MNIKKVKLLSALIFCLAFNYSGQNREGGLSSVDRWHNLFRPASAQAQDCPVTANQVNQYLSQTMSRARVSLGGLGGGTYRGEAELARAINEVKNVWLHYTCYNLRPSIEGSLRRAWRYHVQNIYRSDMARAQFLRDMCLAKINPNPNRDCSGDYTRAIGPIEARYRGRTNPGGEIDRFFGAR